MGTKINKEGIKFAKQADKIDKIEMIGASKSLVTLKDHKGNFMNHHTTSLVNPSKNEIERINDKRLYKFLQININDFYPSIKETLLHEDIKLAKEHLPITR